MLAAPAAAQAADTYVDLDTGSDGNPSCTQALPCKTVQHGLDVATAGATVFVDPDTYDEAVTVGGGKSLRNLDFAAPVEGSLPLIDGGTTLAAIHVPAGQSAGVIDAFVLRSDTAGIQLEGPATVSHNTFDEGTIDSVGVIVATDAAGGSVIDANTFTDPTPAGDQQAVNVSAGSPRISGNTITGYQLGVFAVLSADPTITGNTISAVHPGAHTGAGIDLFNSAKATIVANTITTLTPSGTVGVLVSVTGTPAGATLRRNRIIDLQQGVKIEDQTGEVTLNGDLIAGSAVGIEARDNAPLDNGGDLTVTNVTVADTSSNGGFATDATITVDSSSFDVGIGTSGGGTCEISFSRGPTTTPGGDGCSNFQTSADPMFLNPGAGNFHLQAASPLVDVGNPAAPAAGVLHLDGGPRSCDGDGNGVLRRDIGADELRVPASDDCKVPNSSVRKPKVNRAKRRARIRFSSTDPGSSFKCKLDGRPFRACTSPITYRHLRRGRHTFQVLATDSFGNVELAPATRRFRVRRPR